MEQPEEVDRAAGPASSPIEANTTARGDMEFAFAYCPRCSARLARHRRACGARLQAELSGLRLLYVLLGLLLSPGARATAHRWFFSSGP
jgi:hypothetical protein